MNFFVHSFFSYCEQPIYKCIPLTIIIYIFYQIVHFHWIIFKLSYQSFIYCQYLTHPYKLFSVLYLLYPFFLQTFNLDPTTILCKAGRELVKISQRVQIPHFLACVKCYFSKMVKVDEVILECISEIYKQV